MPLASIGWPDVMIALIAGLPGIIAAIAALRVHGAIKTPSGTPIGKQVEATHHVALGNNYRLRSVTGDLGAETPPRAADEEAKVPELDGE